MKTIKLSDELRLDRERVSDILSAAVVIAVLLFARTALNGPRIDAQTIVQPTQRTIYILSTAPAVIVPTAIPAPTWPPPPTPEPIVIVEQAPPPEIQYVEVPVYILAAPVEMAVDTPAPVNIVNEPACDERCQNIRGHYVEPRP